MLVEPDTIAGETKGVPVIITLHNTMRGLCHSCYSTGVETFFDNIMNPICKECKSEVENSK